jgi:dsDNA-binding SOS-regulon protein
MILHSEGGNFAKCLRQHIEASNSCKVESQKNILSFWCQKERDAVSPLAFGGARQTPATRGEATLENLVLVIQNGPTFLILDC